MAGHSKWANIKHRKGAADAKRGKVFSKIAKEIMVCARVSGGDPAQNITLRSLIQKARSVNMPADNIDRAIKKGTGELDDGSAFEEAMYEGYAQDGVGILIEALTDNKNRTVAEIRHAFNKAGANQAGPGAVSRGFHRKGHILISSELISEEELMNVVLENGAEDMLLEDGYYSITTEPNEFMTVADALNEKGIEMQLSEITFLPETQINISDASKARSIMRFVDALEDLDDVQNVFTNMDIDDSIMAELEEE